METYVIFRRNGWRTPGELQEAAARSTAEGERMGEGVRWIRSYVIAERDGSLGTVCVYQAVSPEAIRRHALRSRVAGGRDRRGRGHGDRSRRPG